MLQPALCSSRPNIPCHPWPTPLHNSTKSTQCVNLAADLETPCHPCRGVRCRQSPYCLLRYGSQEFRSRPSHRGGRHPVWNQTFRITLTAEDVLHVDIFVSGVLSVGPTGTVRLSNPGSGVCVCPVCQMAGAFKQAGATLCVATLHGKKGRASLLMTHTHGPARHWNAILPCPPAHVGPAAPPPPIWLSAVCPSSCCCPAHLQLRYPPQDDSGCRGLTSLGHAAVSLAPLRTAASSGAGGGTSGTDEGQQQQQQQQLQQLQVQAPVLSGRRTVTAALQPPTTATSPQAAPARHKGPLLSVLLELAPPDPPPPVLRVAHAAAAPPLTTTTPAPQPALGIPAYPSQQPPPASPPPPLPPPLLHPSPYPPPPQDASAYPSSHPPPHAAVQHCLGARHQQHHNLHNGGGGAAGPAGWAQAMPYGGCGGGGVLGVPRWEYPVAPGAGPGKHYTHYMQALADAGLLAAAGSRAPVHMPGVEPGLQQ